MNQQPLNDDLAQLPVTQPPPFPPFDDAIIRPATRVSQRLKVPGRGGMFVDVNILIPSEEQPPLRAYWPIQDIKDAIYGSVWYALVLCPRVPSNILDEPAVEWEVTMQPVAIKELEWARIRNALPNPVENPANEKQAIHIVGTFKEHLLVPQHVLQDATNLYFIIPFCSGGELLNVLQGQRTFTEAAARFWIQQILKVSGASFTKELLRKTGVVQDFSLYSVHVILHYVRLTGIGGAAGPGAMPPGYFARKYPGAR